MKTLTDRYIELIMGHRIAVLFIVIVMCAAAASGLSRLTFAADYRVFFGPQNPELAEWDNFQATYSKNDNVLFVLQFPEGDKFDAKLAMIVEEMTEKAWRMPNVSRVDSLSNFQRTEADGDTLIVEDLIVGADKLSKESLQERVDYALSEPALYRALISADSRTTGINVNVELLKDPDKEMVSVALAAKAITRDMLEKYPGLRIAMNGSIIMNYGFIESGERDAMTLIPAMYAAMLIMTLIMFRSFSAMVVTFITIVLSTIVALGLSGYAGIQLAPITIIAPNIILTLAIADCIHIISGVKRELRDGVEKIGAIKASLSKNFIAVFITSVTTAIGFLCLNFSDAPPFQYLGTMTAFGVLAAWILAITLVPVFLSYMPLKPAAEAQSSWLALQLQRLADVVLEKRNTVLAVGGILSALFIGLAFTNGFDDRFSRYFGESLAVRQDIDFASKNLRGQDIFEYDIKSSGPNGISNPEYLKTLDGFTQWLRQQPEVGQVSSISDTFKRLNQNMNRGDPVYYKISDDPELTAQYLLLYELSLPFGLDLNNQISLDRSSTRLSVILIDMEISKQNLFHQRVSQWVSKNASVEMISSPTGIAKIMGSLTLRNLADMITGNIVAIATISLLMMLTLKSFTIGAISVVTNAIPALITFGLWAVAVGHIGMAVAVIGAASLGIVVDDSVHFLTQYLRGIRTKGLTREDAVRFAFAEVGEAIVFTTIIVGVGFAMIAMSTFQVNAQLGLMVAITVVIALLFDFVMLPAILLIGGKRRQTDLNIRSRALQG